MMKRQRSQLFVELRKKILRFAQDDIPAGTPFAPFASDQLRYSERE